MGLLDLFRTNRYFTIDGLQEDDDNISNINLYENFGIAKTLIDIPIEDVYRAGYSFDVKHDDNLEIPETITDNIKKLLINKFHEHKIDSYIKKGLIDSRIYNKGSLIYYSVSKTTNFFEFLNLVNQQDFQVNKNVNDNLDPTIKDYNKPTITLNLNNIELNDSNHFHITEGLLLGENEYVSSLSELRIPLFFHKKVTETISQMLENNTLLTVKFKNFGTNQSKITKKTLDDLKNSMKNYSLIVIGNEDDTKRETYSFSGIKDLIDFSWQNLSGVSKIPRSRIMGNQQGTISASSYDIKTYYDEVERIRKNNISPIYNKLIEIFLNENGTDLNKLYLGYKGKLVVKVDWNNLYVNTELEQVQIEKIKAETDNLKFNINELENTI